jgi:hypothetical protein
MKKNNERIIKYLSEVMTDEERHSFEKELSESTELKESFTMVERALSSFKPDEEIIGERYFNSLLPKVHNRLERRDIYSFWQKIYYLVHAAAAAIICMLFLFRQANSPSLSFETVAAEVVNKLSDAEVSNKYIEAIASNPEEIISYSDDSNISAVVPSEVDVNEEVISKYLNDSSVEEYSTLNGLDDADVEIIASNLNQSNVNR